VFLDICVRRNGEFHSHAHSLTLEQKQVVPTVVAILTAAMILCLAQLTFEVWKDYVPVSFFLP